MTVTRFETKKGRGQYEVGQLDTGRTRGALRFSRAKEWQECRDTLQGTVE